jgi:hypothetical protein
VCRPVVPEPQTTASKMTDMHVCGTEPVGRYRCRGARSRVGVGCLSILPSVGARAGQVQRTSRTLPGVCNFTARPPGVTTMQTDAHNKGR